MELEAQAIQPNSFRNDPDLIFQYRLARDLGMTVAELTTTISHKEFMLWAGFYVYEQTEKDKAIAMAQAESKKRR